MTSPFQGVRNFNLGNFCGRYSESGIHLQYNFCIFFLLLFFWLSSHLGMKWCTYAIDALVLSLSVKTWSPYATSHRPRPPLPYSPGRMPYSGMGNAETREQVCKQGYRMPPPPGCPDQIGILLEECWRQDADDRPTMDMVLDHLDEVTSIFPDV